MRRSSTLALVLTALLSTWAIGAGAAELEVAIDFVGSPSPPEVVLTAVRTGGRRLPDAEQPSFVLDPSSPATIELASGVRWRLTLDVPGFWAEPVRITLGEDGGRARFRVFPAGTLHGRLELSDELRMPRALSVQMTATGYGPQAAEETKLRCPVEDGNWGCVAPAGEYDLILSVPGAGPLRRWSFFVERDEANEILNLEFRVGASVTGVVMALEGEELPAEYTVSLGVPGYRAPDKLAGFEVQPTAEGFFQFTGVEEGTYRVVSSPEGYISTMSPQFEVEGAGETPLDPLVLPRAAKLELLFTPPTDPFDTPWGVQLVRLDPPPGQTSQTIAGITDLTGYWSDDQLRPGSYKLTLSGEIGSWEIRRLDLDYSNPLYEINLGVIGVEGRVTQGSDPRSVELSFHSHEPRKRVSLASDENGEYRGFLPFEGTWAVRINLEGNSIPYAEVRVRPLQGSQVARVDVEVPGTVLVGQVIDSYGEPVPDASVVVKWLGTGNHGELQITADAAGIFRAEGVPQGNVAVRPVVKNARGRMPWTYTAIREDGDEESPFLVQLPAQPGG